MIDVLGRASTVLTAVGVTTEDRPAAYRNRSFKRNPDISAESHHGWNREGPRRRMPHFRIVLDNAGSSPRHQNHRPAAWYHRERLKGRVENQGPTHS